MAWQTSTATDYKDLFNKLVAFATGNSVQSAAVNAGGTGYVVGDIITASGGTFAYAATFEVLTLSGSAVATVRVNTAGLYTANPSNPVSTTGGTGTGCTLDLTIAANGWTAVRQTKQAASATVGAGGTGYTVGDDITVVGGTFTTAAVFNVDSVSSGAVTGVSLVTAGEYRDVAANPRTTTGGTGTGCTLNVTYIPYTGANEREAILLGSGGGSDSIYVGMKTYQQANGPDTAFNWTLVAMTAFNAAFTLDAQPGVSPGAIPASSGGAYVPMHNNGAFPITFWFSVNSYRIIFVAKVENAIVTHYVSGYLGFLNRFGTSTEFPYPIYVSGSTSRHDCLFNTTAPSITGLTELVGISSRTGPAYIRYVDSTWNDVRNSIAIDSGTPSRSTEKEVVCYPCGQTNLSFTAVDDLLTNDGTLNWDDMIPATGIPGTPAVRLQQTPHTPSDLHLLVPATICLSESASILDIWGELDNVFWTSGFGGVSSGDLIKSGNNRYRIFQNGNRTAEFCFMAIQED